MLTMTAAAALYLATAAASSATFAQAADEPAPDDRIKCRRIEVTGSRTQGQKVCKTVAEWRKMRELGSELAREIVDHSRSRQGGQ